MTFLDAFLCALVFWAFIYQMVRWVWDAYLMYRHDLYAKHHFEKTERYYRGFY